MISEHSFAGAFRDILVEFGKVLGAENLPGRKNTKLEHSKNLNKKDLLFPYQDSFKGDDLITRRWRLVPVRKPEETLFGTNCKCVLRTRSRWPRSTMEEKYVSREGQKAWSLPLGVCAYKTL